MNCERFQANLHDYLDDALSPGEKASSQSHLQTCNACRQAVGNERFLAQTLSAHLTDAVKTVTLDARSQRKMAAAIQKQFQNIPEPKRNSALASWIFHLAIPAAAACLILMSAIWLGRGFIHGDSSATTSPLSSINDIEIPVHVTYSARHYTFHQEGTMVVDALTSDNPVADGALLAKR